MRISAISMASVPNNKKDVTTPSFKAFSPAVKTYNSLMSKESNAALKAAINFIAEKSGITKEIFIIPKEGEKTLDYIKRVRAKGLEIRQSMEGLYVKDPKVGKDVYFVDLDAWRTTDRSFFKDSDDGDAIIWRYDKEGRVISEKLIYKYKNITTRVRLKKFTYLPDDTVKINEYVPPKQLRNESIKNPYTIKASKLLRTTIESGEWLTRHHGAIRAKSDLTQYSVRTGKPDFIMQREINPNTAEKVWMEANLSRDGKILSGEFQEFNDDGSRVFEKYKNGRLVERETNDAPADPRILQLVKDNIRYGG